MTTKERNALQNLINKYNQIEAEQTNYFNQLQAAVRQVSNNQSATCAAKENLKILLGTQYEKEAIVYFSNYEKLGGQLDILNLLGNTLAEINFWKE